MSDGEMEDDLSLPTQQSQGFNIVDVLSTGSCTSIGQDSSLDASDSSPHVEINRKSELFVDEAIANENLKKLYPFVDQNITPLPRYWNPTDKYKSLILSTDCLRVHYGGKRDSQKDAAAVRANHSIPRNCAVYYFEILVVKKGDTGYLGIGLCEKDVNLNRLPGWDSISYGFHGDDGNFFSSSGKGRDYGPKFTTGDIVGCGINFVSRTIFFTKNGVNIGVAATNVPIDKPLFPTLGMQAKDQIVDTNFGQSKFHYCIETDIKESELKTLSHIQTIRLPVEKSVWMTRLMADWLNNFGYSQTLSLFNEATSTVCKESIEVLEERRQIMQLINNRRISEAIRRTNLIAPQVLEQNKQLALQLKIQEFIELFALMKSGDTEAYGEYLEANQLDALDKHETTSSPVMGTSASTSNLTQPRNKRAAPESSGLQGEAKRRSNQANESRFTTGPRRSSRNTQQQPTAITEDSQNGRQFESSQNQTNGHVEDHSTNGLSATNGNAHPDHLSTTNGATPPTSTNIIAEMDDDEYSYTSDFSSSAESDWEMENATDADKSKDELGFPDDQFSVIVSMGQKISAFASKVPDVPSELLRRMDDAFSMVCYDDPYNCPKSYLFNPEFRKYLANALNSAIVAVTNKDMLTSPESFLQKARQLRECALQVSTVGAVYADEKRVFQPGESFQPTVADEPHVSRPTSSSSGGQTIQTPTV